MFCVHIYNKLNSLCIYSTYTVQEHHLIIIYCSLFCERVAFIFDIMVFLAHQYIGETTTIKNFDGPTSWNCVEESPFYWGCNELRGFVCSLTTFFFFFGRDPTDDKHNFVSFAFQIVSLCLPFSPRSIQRVFIFHPVAVICKIIPQTEKH